MLSIFRDENGQTVLDVKGCKSMAEVKCLKMSNMGFAELDVHIFKKLPNIEEIDISGNLLRRIPTDLYLPRLKKLNCSNNQLADVTFLQQFPHLEELYMTDNKLTFADQCIAALICPDLKKIDKRSGADIDVGRLNLKMEKRLEPVINRVWELYFARSYKKEPNLDAAQLQRSLVYHVKRMELYRPKMLEKFRDYKLACMVKEYLAKHVEAEDFFTQSPSATSTAVAKPDDEEAGCSGTVAGSIEVIETPEENGTAEVRGIIVIGETVVVRETVEIRETVEEALEPSVSEVLELSEVTQTKRKRVTFECDEEKDCDARKKPAKKDDKESPCTLDAEFDKDITKSLGKDYSRKRTSDCPSVTAEEVEEVEVPEKQMPTLSSEGAVLELPALRGADPLFLLRCHSASDPTDEKIQVHRCAFEPDPSSPGSTTNVVATCGGEVLCLVDCMTGLVHKSYKHPKADEDFLALAWTTVELTVGSSTKKTNLLAVAGVLKEIRIFHPENLVCYGAIKAHTLPINCLCFHPTKSTWLFSGSADGEIMLWEITVLSSADCNMNYSAIAVYKADMAILSMVVSAKCEFLISGCEGGCFGWQLSQNGEDQRQTRSPCVRFHFPLKETTDTQQPCVFDGLVVVSEDLIATKCAGQGCILLWRLKDTLQSETLVAARTVDAVAHVVAMLEWSSTASICTGPSCHPSNGILSFGDDLGQVWIYNLKPLFKKTARDFDARSRYAPSVVLQWISDEASKSPADGTTIAVNATALSGCGEYLVAVTGNNSVCIWALML